MLTAIVAVLRYFRQDAALRAICLYFAVVAFIVGGPLQVALPIFTQGALSGDAATYSQLMLAQGVGTLAGMVLSGARPGWRIGGLGTTVLLADGLSGLLFIPLSLSTTVWQVAPLMALTGMLMGYLQVAVFSWMQRRVPLAMLGRAMSLFMFIFMGLAPLSAALAGLLLRWLAAGQLFLACGLCLLAIVGPTLLLGGCGRCGKLRPEPVLAYDRMSARDRMSVCQGGTTPVYRRGSGGRGLFSLAGSARARSLMMRNIPENDGRPACAHSVHHVQPSR